MPANITGKKLRLLFLNLLHRRMTAKYKKYGRSLAPVLKSRYAANELKPFLLIYCNKNEDR